MQLHTWCAPTLLEGSKIIYEFQFLSQFFLNLYESNHLCFPHCSPLIPNTLSSEKLRSQLDIIKRRHNIVDNRATELLPLQGMAGVRRPLTEIHVTRYCELEQSLDYYNIMQNYKDVNR
jgi:hypothetical protein